ncbi:MAG: hypothetical protein AAFR61_00695 [Bacteroidota bacterium]
MIAFQVRKREDDSPVSDARIMISSPGHSVYGLTNKSGLAELAFSGNFGTVKVNGTTIFAGELAENRLFCVKI